MYFKDLTEVKDYFSNNLLNDGEELMIFLADESDDFYEPMADYFNQQNIKFFGGIYPGLLVKDLYLKSGLIINIIKPVFRTVILPFLAKSYNGDRSNLTALLIADGLSAKFKSLIDTVYKKYQDEVTYVGGGAGYYDLEHRPCVFDEKGVYEDIMIMALIDAESQVEYRHGWERLKGPYYVNQSVDNMLKEIDSIEAFDVYQDAFEDIQNIYLTHENFFEFAKDHPFGIANSNQLDVVRDPIAVNENNEIICVASIPEESDIYILKGNSETLLNASSEVATKCSETPYESYKPFLFDCISRAMYLEERFIEELANIQNMLDYPVYGALSIGEISSMQNGNIEIHNKSAVLAVVKD